MLIMSKHQTFLNSIYKGDILETLQIMRIKGIRPHTSTDSKGYTALHVIALNSSTRIGQFLIAYIQDTYPLESENILKDWVNKATEERFTPLHFACYRGNFVSST